MGNKKEGQHNAVTVHIKRQLFFNSPQGFCTLLKTFHISYYIDWYSILHGSFLYFRIFLK
jgi:hypothetical protein